MFIRWGFKRVTMDDIAREMSMSKKTIYQFFKDKNEMVCAVTEEHLQKEEALMEQLERESENVIEFLVKITTMIRQHMTRVNPSALMDLQRHYPDGWKIFVDYKTRVFHQSLVRTLARGIQEGYFREDINPEIIAILRIEQVQLCFEDRVFPRNRFDMTDVQLQVFRHFVEGIMTQKGRDLLETYKTTLQPHETLL
ncbi:mycofactocin system transcriptional regulator [Cesiribacter andamanensis AMV16]|uniref:Mycofactocin system transcriptional regulator n=2 Tax=Cesiribacter TaxID=1133570 RepID=M7N2A9_9BACT|nr:mycofactocin system transcriptional regulator [Cesiribacter andamanensis AMV16]